MTHEDPPDVTALERTLETYYALGLHALEALEKGDGEAALSKSREMDNAWKAFVIRQEALGREGAPIAPDQAQDFQERLQRTLRMTRRLEEEFRKAQTQVAVQLRDLHGAAGSQNLPEPQKAREILVEI